MINFFEITNNLKQLARKKITAYETAKEFNGLIVAFIVLKFIIMAVSVYSGYSFFTYNLCGILTSPTARITAAVLILVSLEVINAYLLEKFFKFALKHNKGAVKKCVSLFVMIVCFFSISFYISCKGIELLKSDTTELKQSINTDHAAELAALNAEIEQRTSILDQSIKSICSYKGRYTVAQSAKIDSLNNAKIALFAEKRERAAKLEDKHKDQLTEITITAAEDGNKYYKYVAVLMVLQLVCNGLIVFFLTKIFNENETETIINENLFALSEDFEEKANGLFERVLNTATAANFNAVETALAAASVNRYVLKSKTAPNIIAPAAATVQAPITDGQQYGIRSRAINDQQAAAEPEQTAEPPHKAKKYKIFGFAGHLNEDQPPNQEQTAPQPAQTTEPKAQPAEPAPQTAPQTEQTQPAAADPGAEDENNIYENRIYERSGADSETAEPATEPKAQPAEPAPQTAPQTEDTAAKYGFAVCPVCGKHFVKNHKKHVYCVPECRYQHHANEHNKPYKFGGVWYYPQS